MKKIVVIVIIFCCVLFGCKTNEMKNNAAFTIGDINWIIWNVPYGDNYGNNDGSCEIEFRIQLDGTIQQNELVSAGFSINNHDFVFDIINNFNYEEKMIHQKISYVIDGNDKKNATYIGNAKIWVKTINNQMVLKNFCVSEPGNLSTNKSIVYNEEFQINKFQKNNKSYDKYIPCLSRPTKIEYTLNNNILTIEFNEFDQRCYTGGIMLFNSEGHVIASTLPFVSYSTGESLSIINDGKGINNNGIKNIVKIKLDEMQYYYDFSKNNLNGFLIIITDGLQYSGSGSLYNYITQSEYISVK